MKIQWHPDLATGHREIDSDHQELFQKIDTLVTACKENKEKPVVLELLPFLKQYVNSHLWPRNTDKNLTLLIVEDVWSDQLWHAPGFSDNKAAARTDTSAGSRDAGTTFNGSEP